MSKSSPYEMGILKHLINSNRVEYDYLVEKKGYFLGKFASKYINHGYLEGLLKEDYWAPEIEKS